MDPSVRATASSHGSSDPAALVLRAEQVRARLPEGGLFTDARWRIATGPLLLPPRVVREIETLGRVLLQFYRAVNLLYRRSVEGAAPAWFAQWLDQGKPAELIELQRDAAFRNDVPRVLRPDLLVTEDGLAISELDSVPGGIGLTTWLYEAYEATSEGGEAWVGNAAAMRAGFRGIFGKAPRAHLIVSEESASYRPEMAWLAPRLEGIEAAVRGPEFTDWSEGDAVYRFFELFDAANVPAAARAFAEARAGRIRLTPPPRPMFEEKLLFGLFWNRHLRESWRRELGEGFQQRLQKLVPYTWVMDPAPLPPHAGLPGLDLSEWQQLKALSQRERDLIVKISGYSPTAWGARGVHLGSDLSAADWAAAVDQALAAWPSSPHVLQRYHKPGLMPIGWLNEGTPETMQGRVRLCPYYFVHGDGDAARPQLGGVLATVCPADKKIIHGMVDAVLAPCAAAPATTGGTPS